MSRAAALGLLAAVVLGACGSSGSGSTTAPPPPPQQLATMHLTSPAFVAGAAIPRTYTCDGPDLPLPLRWSGIPASARELVLVMRDPDAPGGNFVHWAVAGIPPTASGLPAKGVVEGRNSFGTVGYRGPCPPAGDKAHHYVLTLSALGGRSGLGAGFSADQLHTAAVGLATLVGTYRRR